MLLLRKIPVRKAGTCKANLGFCIPRLYASCCQVGTRETLNTKLMVECHVDRIQ